MQVKYYDYGVVERRLRIHVRKRLGFAGDARRALCAQPELERTAQEIVRERLERISAVIVRPYDQWISEDYYVFVLTSRWQSHRR